MLTKSLLNRKVQLALGAAVLAPPVMGVISFVEKVAKQIQELLNEEISSRMVNSAL